MFAKVDNFSLLTSKTINFLPKLVVPLAGDFDDWRLVLLDEYGFGLTSPGSEVLVGLLSLSFELEPFEDIACSHRTY